MSQVSAGGLDKLWQCSEVRPCNWEVWMRPRKRANKGQGPQPRPPLYNRLRLRAHRAAVS